MVAGQFHLFCLIRPAHLAEMGIAAGGSGSQLIFQARERTFVCRRDGRKSAVSGGIKL